MMIWNMHNIYLPSRWAAPPSVTVLTKMPSFSRPMSAPAPIPIILIPKPSLSVDGQQKWRTQYRELQYEHAPFTF